MYGKHVESYQYDALDNIRRRDFFNGATTRTDTYTYDTANRLQSISSPGGVQTFGYGPRGNMSQRLNLTHTFNSANQLVSVSNGYRFEYDGYGRRTVSWRPDGVGKMDVYDASGVVRYTSDGRLSGGITYLHLGGTLIGERFTRWDGTGEEIKYVHTDTLGSPVVRTDRWGNVIERERFMAFGQAVDGSVRETLGFTGHMEDPALGLTYMQQRYYDPAIGRFLSVDPVGPLSDPVNHVNRYRYARNNPYRFIDPDGAADIIFFQRDENLVPAARRFDIPNWFTVMGHAGVREPEWELRTRDDRRSQKIWAGPRLSTQQLISEIREGGLSSRDQGVFLGVCNIGQVAAQVASDLGKPVIAADGFV